MTAAAQTYDVAANSGLIDRIPARRREQIFLIPVEEVASIVADGELLKITTEENQTFVINFRLKDLEARLDSRKFIRLSRAALVNLDMVAHIAPMSGGTYTAILKHGQDIAASRSGW